MATLEELQSLCSEFSNNFAQLSAKYQAQSDELEEERSAHRRTQQNLKALQEEFSRISSQKESQKASADDANVYKERYYATCVAVEHLKGRLESAKKAMMDRDQEYNADKEQWQLQMRDFASRLNTDASAQQLKTLKNRIVELEEQCAILSGHTIEEKERFAQSQLVANTAVRDLQSKISAAEARLREMEGENTQLRTMIRRLAEVERENASKLDESELASSRYQSALSERDRQVKELKAKLSEVKRETSDTLQEKDLQHEKLTKQLRQDLRASREELERVHLERSKECEKIAEVRLTANKRLSTVSEEYQREIDSCRSEKLQIWSELQASKRQISSFEQCLKEREQDLEHANERERGTDQKLQDQQKHMELLAQREQWLMSERDQLKEEVDQLRCKTSDMATALSQRDSVLSEVARLKLQVQFSDAEATDTKRAFEALASRVHGQEGEYERRISQLQKRLRQQEREHKRESSNHHSMRKKAVLDAYLVGHAPPADEGRLGGDLIEILKGQTSEAESIHKRLVALSH